jgi:uncharacterized protein YdhG (YjbR/CyaY superfamily)
MTPPETVTAYIAGFPPPTQAILRRVRGAIRKALPRADELAPYEVNDKGTIRFPLTAPVPTALIGRLAAFRASEVGASAPRVRRR